MRFLGFDDAWDYVRVSDLIETYSTNSLSWDMLDYENGTILNLHYGLIHSGLPTQIDCRNDKLPFIKCEYMPKHYTLCEEGDIAFADASEDTEEVGKVVEFNKCNEKDIVCGLHTIHARDKVQRTVVGYKGYAFSSVPFHHQIRRIAQGTKIYSINTRNFEEVYIGVPSKAEQRKIADFLCLIDERINTQSKIIEKLQSQMIAIYHRLFRGTDDAFIKQLKEICTIRKGTQVNGTELLENGRYYFMNGGITPSGYFNSWNTEAETISISEGGNSCGYVQFNTVRFWSGGHCYTLVDLVDCVIPKFLYHYLKAHEEEIMRMRIGTGLPNIQKKDLETLLIYVPTLEKQKHYLKLLETIEQKITIEQRLLKILKEQKKFLLSNMFI